MRRRKLLVALAGLAVVVAVGVVGLWPQPQSDRVTREYYNRIHAGMALGEVVATLGPPGDYTTGPTEFRGVQAIEDTSRWTSPDKKWEGDQGVIFVALDRGAAQRIRRAWFRGWTKIEQSPLDNLLWRAKRQWRRWFPE
jgi:hypothetical protein